MYHIIPFIDGVVSPERGEFEGIKNIDVFLILSLLCILNSA
jgi:hypothetical protein